MIRRKLSFFPTLNFLCSSFASAAAVDPPFALLEVDSYGNEKFFLSL